MMYEAEVRWKLDVALEISVDVDHPVARVRLVGVLDGSTAVKVKEVVGDLLEHGASDFEITIEGLDVSDPDGSETLASLQRLVARSGGHVLWRGSPNTVIVRLVPLLPRERLAIGLPPSPGRAVPRYSYS